MLSGLVGYARTRASNHDSCTLVEVALAEVAEGLARAQHVERGDEQLVPGKKSRHWSLCHGSKSSTQGFAAYVWTSGPTGIEVVSVLAYCSGSL